MEIKIKLTQKRNRDNGLEFISSFYSLRKFFRNDICRYCFVKFKAILIASILSFLSLKLLQDDEEWKDELELLNVMNLDWAPPSHYFTEKITETCVSILVYS